MTIDPAVLRFWYETEILTLPRVPAPSGPLPAAPGDEPGVVALGPGQVPPWPVAPVVDERGTRWVARHYVYLGLYRHHDAVADLLRSLDASRDDPDRLETLRPVERERSLQEGCLAGFGVDHRGSPAGRTFVLASLPWALGRLRRGLPLRGFQAASGEAAAEFAGRWRAEGPDAPDGEAAPMAADDLVTEAEAIGRQVGWAPERPSRWVAVVRRWWRHEATGTADEEVVNSFYLDDLERAHAAVSADDAGAALRLFLQGTAPERRTDIWRDARALAGAVRPGAVPPARWPAPGLPAQSLMQQAAIDLAMERLLPAGGLFSVDGPPGTGKTTLLRDLVAAIVAERARRLAELERPEDAFERGERVPVGSQTRAAWHVKPGLRGFEMVVASSVNGAVENVTLEIPAVETIDEAFRPRLDYYREVATAIAAGRGRAGGASWGLIAAVLGNARNRRRFARRAWFGEPSLRDAMTADGGPDWDQARAGFEAALDREREHRERAIAAAGTGGAGPGDRPEEERQRALPWMSAEHDRCRAEVFVAAMAVHRALASAAPLRDNLSLAIDLVTGRLDPRATAAGARMAADLWTSFFLVVPVVSTTFASFGRLFRGLGREDLGWLFLDEAGQAQPAHAVGALWRSRRALVIGDPRQIPPVVTLPGRVYGRLRERSGVGAFWDPSETSVQVIADHANPVGARLRDGTWLGCPLRVHRRCASPMFEISNAIAYDGMMVPATVERPSPVGELLGPSRWIDVRGHAGEEHWIDEEGEVAATLLDALLRQELVHGRRPDVFVISPFRSVAVRARRLFRSRWRDPRTGRPAAAVADWVENGIGTIHTFQGKEAEAVVLLLGGHPDRPRARGWAGETPNILNVAVTRARLRLYVIGNRAAWRTAGFFGELDRRMPPSD